MLGDTITLTINAESKVLRKINQDQYSSEYLLREALGELRLKVRHTAETRTLRGEKMDRHNVELSHTIYGVSPDDGYTVVVSTTLRNPERITGTEVDYLSDGMADFIKSNAVALTGWES